MANAIKKRWKFFLGVVVFSSLPLLAIAFGWIYVQNNYNDEALAKLIMKGFNKNRRGRLVLKSVHWEPSAVLDLLTGRPTRVLVTGLKMYDVKGQLVVDIPKVSGSVFIGPLRKNISLVFEDVKARKGKILLEMFDSPDNPGSREIGILGMIKSSRKKKKKDPDDDNNELSAKSWVISVKRFDVSGVDLVADLPSLDMDLKGLAMKGGHVYFGTESKEAPRRFHLQGRPTARVADVKLLGSRHLFRNIIFTMGYMDRNEPMNLHFALKALEGVSKVNAIAFLGDHGIIVDVKADKVAKMASRYIPLITLTDGPGSSADIKIRGTLYEPIVQIKGKGLRFPNNLGRSVDNLSGTLLFQRNEGYSTINFFDVQGTTGDATLVADGMWDLVTGNIFTNVQGVQLDPREYLPSSMENRVPHNLNGKVTLRTVFPDVKNLVFGWKLKGGGGLLNNLVSDGSVTYSNGAFIIKNFNLNASEISANVIGEIDLDHRLSLKTKLSGRNMGRFLGRLGIIPLISSLNFNGTVTGPLVDPNIYGNVDVGGFNIKGVKIPNLHGFLKLDSRTAGLSGIGGRYFGGKIRGSGWAKWKRGLWINGSATVKDIRLEKITSGVASGGVNLKANVHGQVLSMNGKVNVEMPKGELLGLPMENGKAEIKLRSGNVIIKKGEIRIAKSKVSLGGDIGKSGDLDLRFTVDGLVIKKSKKWIVSGIVNGDLGIKGSVGQPGLDGWLALENPSLYGKRLKKRAILHFSHKDDQNSVSGDFFNLLKLKGDYDLRPDLKSNMRVVFNDLNPTPFFPPGFLENIGIKLKMSGNLSASYKAGEFPVAKLEMSKADVGILGSLTAYGVSKVQETLVLGSPLLVNLDKNGIFAKKVNLKGVGTSVLINAGYDYSKVVVSAFGDVGLVALPYVLPKGTLDSSTGSVAVKIKMEADTSGVLLNGDVYFAGNKLSVGSLGESVIIRAGKLKFSNNKLLVDGVRVVYEEEELVARGSFDLGSWLSPSTMAMNLSGLVSSKALMLAMPNALYSTSGRANLDLNILGTVSEPVLKGKLVFNEKNRFFLRSGREFAITKGSAVVFDQKDITLRRLKIAMEDGYILADGKMRWDGRPIDTDITIKMRNIVERSSDYEIEMMGDLRLSCIGNEPLVLRGTIDLLNGSYTKKYNINIVDKLLTPVSRVSESGSGGGTAKWISDMQLDVVVQLTGDIEVDNNFAQTKLEGVANVSGTVDSPRIGGIISLNGGTFRIPMLRGTYEIKEGIINFDRAKIVGHSKDEPWLDVSGEMIFTDRLQNEHIITLRLYGFASQLKLHWSSSTGLRSSQVLMLLMLNRTPEEIRRGDTGGIPDLGGILEGYVPLNLQLGLTGDSVKVYVDKRFLGEHVILRGNVEVGFMGRQVQEAFLIFRFHDNLRIQTKARRKVAEEETAIREDEDELQGRVELKYKIKFKGNWKDILGL
jgi:TamB, inner membrane protein subunit of TAM complex